MFNRNTDDALNDFIEKPSQDCTDREIKEGVEMVVLILQNNPATVMNTLKNHMYVCTASLLHDLADKMRKYDTQENQNSITNLNTLYDRFFDTLVEACTYNLYDLDRFIEAMPENKEKILGRTVTDYNFVKRILEANGDREETLKEIEKKYSNDYRDKFRKIHEGNNFTMRK